MSQTESRKTGSAIGALWAAASFLTFVPHPAFRSPATLWTLGRHFWWAVVFQDLCLVFPFALAADACAHVLGSPLLGAVLFVAATHFVHGFRRLDGFADLGEAVLYKLSNPQAQPDALWAIARAPQNGTYGTALVCLFLLLETALATNLLQAHGWAFVAGTCSAAMLSHLAVGAAVSCPERFRPDSDFQPFAQGCASWWRLCLLGIVTLLLSFGMTAGAGFRWTICLALSGTGGAASVAAGLATRFLVSRSMGRLNGDVIGLSWCLSEAALLLAANLLLPRL